ncbi:CvpA family protein [Sphingomonas sp.]|uniref:CvpA family protein n=1 Tax=Sphingomonas sp. TaxID=28214 RepID=UPI001B07727C|nr:CvpA family protein [Sphingomonas sp.]MBO9711587.1 CvpA family protein [Sphingomonas sp.]
MTSLDIIVLLAVGGSAVLGAWRGFVTEVLALLVWVAMVVMLKLLHAPLTTGLAGVVGTWGGAAVLAFALIEGVTYFGGRMLARAIGARARASVFGSLDRALGLGFGALKGLILVSLGFLLLVLVIDTIGGGPKNRPQWMTQSMSYPLLQGTSQWLAEFVTRRSKGESVFGNSSEAGGVTTSAD